MVVAYLQSGVLQFCQLRSALRMLAQATEPAPALPEPVRQIAYMALLGILLLGMLMIVATLLGGHWVRRWGDRLRRPAVPPDTIIAKRPRSDHSDEHSDESSVNNSVDNSASHKGDERIGPDASELGRDENGV